MSRSKPAPPPATAKVVRCAIYTRKSSEEGLALEFNSLDAQREAAEAYVASQRAEGWAASAARYDDGGFSGGSMDRPALARLLADVAAGRVDCVVVYKVDRLSRSLPDFARILETFDKHKVAFCSVTQQFNTTHSMGRLTLNILLSFAQFEREIIGERIRDKLAAQRRRGKWTGGAPVLGYDVDRTNPSPRLVVNAAEAARAREIFALYLEHGSLLPVVDELRRRGWRAKARLTKAGVPVGGAAFDKGRLYALLTNPLYAGRVRYQAKVYAGEHEAVVDPATFDKVQAVLGRNGRTGGVEVRNRHGALLKRLIRCTACGAGMTHTFTTKRGRQYRYYACVRAVKGGRAACPTRSLPAAEVERVVVEQVRRVGRDPALAAEVLAAARGAADAERANLAAERAGLTRELTRDHAELKRLVAGGPAGEGATARLADLAERARQAEGRLAEVAGREAALAAESIDEGQARAALADFDGVWDRLSPREQAKLIGLMVERVQYDEAAGTVAVTFHAAGIRGLGGPPRAAAGPSATTEAGTATEAAA
jgi:site-specific DNA recombinase